MSCVHAAVESVDTTAGLESGQVFMFDLPWEVHRDARRLRQIFSWIHQAAKRVYAKHILQLLGRCT
jgi:hypothetical protein